MLTKPWAVWFVLLVLLSGSAQGQQARAPKEGTYVGGKFYEGGQFLPKGAGGGSGGALL